MFKIFHEIPTSVILTFKPDPEISYQITYLDQRVIRNIHADLKFQDTCQSLSSRESTFSTCIHDCIISINNSGGLSRTLGLLVLWLLIKIGL